MQRGDKNFYFLNNTFCILRNGSAWRSKGRGPGEKPREVKVGPTGGSSRSLEAPGSHGEVLLEGGVVRPVCFKITQLLY